MNEIISFHILYLCYKVAIKQVPPLRVDLQLVLGDLLRFPVSVFLATGGRCCSLCEMTDYQQLFVIDEIAGSVKESPPKSRQSYLLFYFIYYLINISCVFSYRRA